MKKLLKNTFVSHRHNNHTPHVFKRGSVVVIAAIALLTFFGGAMQKVQLYVSDSLAAIYSKTLVALANEDRAEESLEELKINPVLEEAARMKAEDMAENGYFAHYGPDGSAPWDWLKKAGYEYFYAGENLAIDFNDSEQVNRAWMKSPLHRANILNANFTEVGIATVAGTYNGRETIFVVQMFGTPKTTNPVAAPVSTLSLTTIPAVSAPVSVSTTVVPIIVSSSTVAGTSTEESFVVVKGASYNSAEAAMSERILTNPNKVVTIVFTLLFVLVSLGLMGVIFSEFHKHHIRHAIVGVVLLVMIVGIAYAYKVLVVTQVVIQ
ncbi:MAG: hypothetical protein RI911_488 [Candidatus Parcubacteria bacterium]